MNVSNLQTAFDSLVGMIRLLVLECKASGTMSPSMMLMQKWVTLDHVKTDVGIRVSRAQQQFFQKEDWFRAVFKLVDKVKETTEFARFKELLAAVQEKDSDSKLDDAIRKITTLLFEREITNLPNLLDLFLKSLENTPVSAWCDIDVYGISVKGIQNITFNIGNRRVTFRQLDVPDFEEESLAGHAHDASRFKTVPPNCIMRIEMNAWRPLEFQQEAEKAIIVLRLFKVCATKFGRQSWNSVSPFAMIMGSGNTLENVWHIQHELELQADAADDLKDFWEVVESNLPPEMSELSPQKITTTSIAYERYSDGLLASHPIERKITFAIMGLEAIYLRENEVQELMYRLQLRVCKFLSKLGFKNADVRSRLKDGYRIRNTYVHGGHLSEKERKQLEAKGIAIKELAEHLLDFLRVSILHLILSKQSKECFLDLLEDSFIEQDQDERLCKIVVSEGKALRVRMAK